MPSACTSNLGKQINKNTVCKAIGMRCSLFYRHLKDSSKTLEGKKMQALKNESKIKTCNNYNEEVHARVLL